MAESNAFRRNFFFLIWHALFLAFAATFIDVNTVLSSFILNIGGNNVHVGIITGISIGLPMVTQLVFAGFLAGRRFKKPFLLAGIYLRVLALVGMGYTLSVSDSGNPEQFILMIFLWIALFATSGAFAGISYTDILGKTFSGTQREKFLIFKQFVTALGMLASAFVVRKLVISFPYPENYTVIFLSASGLLFIATFGFLFIKEIASPPGEHYGMMQILKLTPRMLINDKNLINYISVINLTSIGLTTIPFYVAYAKSLYGLDRQQVGNFLLLQFVGMIVSTFLWNLVAKRSRFKGIAYGSTLTGAFLPLLVLFLSRYGAEVYQWIFFVAGFLVSAQLIYIQGMLLEISNNENRTIYNGISGALSISAALFPLLAGALIELLGYTIVFAVTFPLVISTLFFLKKIKCHRPEDPDCQ